MDTAARGSLEFAKDVVAEPLHIIHVRVRSRHTLTAIQADSVSYSELTLGVGSINEPPASRCVLRQPRTGRPLNPVLPPILAVTQRLCLREHVPDTRA